MTALAELGIIFALSLSQFFSDRVNIEKSNFRNHLISFAASIAIAYLLLHILPNAYNNSKNLELFIPLTGGFIVIYLLERFFYKKFGGKFSIKKESSYHDEVHAGVLFVYHFIIGAVLIRSVAIDVSEAVLFLIPLMMFTTIGNWSLHHDYLKGSYMRKALLASSTILGAMFAKSPLMTDLLGRLMFNFAAGILLFIIVRESLPHKNKGKPIVFVLGLIFYGLLILLLDQLT